MNKKVQRFGKRFNDNDKVFFRSKWFLVENGKMSGWKSATYRYRHTEPDIIRGKQAKKADKKLKVSLMKDMERYRQAQVVDA